jgi:hypothetical protein
MTQIANFNIAEDLIVEAYLPNTSSNAFLIGISLIGGTNVLADASTFIVGVSLIGGSDVLGDNAGGGGAGLAWQQIECDVNRANISVGGEVQSNLYFQPSPASASLQLQSWTLDPNNNIGFRSGTPIRVRLSDGLVQKTLFSGYIENIDVQYRVDEPNQITLTAFDDFKRYVNSRLATFDTTTGFPAGYVTPNEQLARIAQQLGTQLSSESIATEGRIPSVNLTEVIASEHIYDAIQVALGVLWVDQETKEFVIIPRPHSTEAIPDWTIGNNHGEAGHLCMSDIDTISDTELNVNNLRVELQSNSAIFTVKKNTDTIELYGETAEDVTLNTTDLTRLEDWANRAFNPFPSKIVSQVTTPAIDRNATLTQAAFFNPGGLIGVKYQTSNLDIEDNYTITRVNHQIDPDNWFTTLELWKEF